MAVAADDAVDLVRRDTGLVHRLLAGEDRIGSAPGAVNGQSPPPAPAPLPPMPQAANPILAPPPLIPGRCGHGFPFAIDFTTETQRSQSSKDEPPKSVFQDDAVEVDEQAGPY